jgi:acetylornithine deacetylase/succinyl-diaminopimelate desuccinylase-like protein
MNRFALFLIFLFAFSSTAFSQSDKAIEKQVRLSLEELKSFIALPNDANNPKDIDQNLVWLVKAFSSRGFKTKLLPTEGIPLFFAELKTSPEKPTLLFYMHFDGQSVDRTKWDQEDPYKIALKAEEGGKWVEKPWSALNGGVNGDWRLFGRSTSDDKGPIVMFLNAMDLLKYDKKEIPFNVKVILDGEEEKSSKPLPGAVQKNKELLKSDYLVINDGPVHVSGKPTLVFGCRGITSMSITTFGPVVPQHSGHYGNYAPNPGWRLIHLLDGMKDDQGRVLIKGYYDGIDLDTETKKVLSQVPDDINTIHGRLQIADPEKVGSNYQESLQYPSLNIRGMSSGWVGKEARTIVPESATAELDLRLVVETDGKRLQGLVKDHLKSQGYEIIDQIPDKEMRMKKPNLVMVQEGSVTDAFRTDLDNPFGIWLEGILKDSFSEEVVKIRTMGGTVPIAPFINALDIPAFIVPMVNPDNNQHSPNENLKISQMNYGIKLFYQILTTEYKP